MTENYPVNSRDEERTELPSVLTITKFSAARTREIQIMKKSLSMSSGIKLAFQKLPKHMRRRAMSHNVKRLPRRLREIHMSQMKKSGLPPKHKRPSRKYRRRAYNLTSEYMRRQRKVTWLNTHIWHAKRFHMIEKWGYKIPYCPCDRAFRACYRATMYHCLLQDISYYSCVEISGEYTKIVDNFKKITNSNTGLTIAAKSYIAGSREGCITMFKINDSTAVGIIFFQWKPIENDKKRILWLWIHAAFYNEALDIFQKCFNFELKSEEANISNETPTYTNLDNIEMKLLKLELSRFRLTGPLSNAVLQNAFKLAEVEDHSPEWVKNYFKNISSEQKSPKNYWEDLKYISSAAELPPHSIIPLIVLDPRFNFPKKRTKALPLYSDLPNTSFLIAENFPASPLWESDIRKCVKVSKISNAKIAELRKELLVPGSDLDVQAVAVPILLVQRPGSRNHKDKGYSSGWDLILPSAWAQSIWLSLIMWEARSGGLRETDSIDFESSNQFVLYPDTSAGAEEELSISTKCKEDFFKLPPNKRTNFNKFRIASPFEWNWKLLLSNWSDSTMSVTDFFVLRDKKALRNIQDILVSRFEGILLPRIPANYLIPVCIYLSQKGLCKQFAIICLPLESDTEKDVIELKHHDPNENLRKQLRSEHKVLLKRLRRRRIRGKKNGQNIPIDMEMLTSYKTKMRKLWLPEATDLRHSCSREVIGFVKHGDFSFLTGKSKAIGYIVSEALHKLLLLRQKDKILVRNTNSKQYRFGTLEIIY